MHRTRQELITKIPIPRKGNKYVARALQNTNNSVPVIIAVRDMLNLARTSREVKYMIKQDFLKINSRPVRKINDSINLFNIFEADKKYILKLNKSNKFFFEEKNSDNARICKVIGKKILKGKTIQINLHDGTNIISNSKIKTGDSVYLDSNNKVKSHVPLDKGALVFIISGKYSGKDGKIAEIKENKAMIKFKEGEALLDKNSIIVL